MRPAQLTVQGSVLSAAWAMDLHAAMRCFTSLYFFIHHASKSILLPIGTPNARMVSPSLTHASSLMMPVGARCLWRFSFPISWPSLLVAFSLMAVAWHHVRRCALSLIQSFMVRPMRVLSSAYCEIRSSSLSPSCCAFLSLMLWLHSFLF